MKKGYVANIEEVTKENTDYRRVLYTGEHSQLVVMSLEPGVEIGEEVHHLDQFIRIESGKCKAVLNEDDVYELEDDWCVIVPAGTKHNFINESDEVVKLYSIYSPAEHKDGLVQATKADDAEVHFDGVTTE
ncbi:cupin domain-containing protein [Candidatus Kaiserbacteria bacterium]|nr:cupin domain-containing protein [Candidatus Kaiserbacteria bacterium]MCB9812138.1 cupin domain-containing protein [Candidatus Nomurabacteria bacterium]